MAHQASLRPTSGNDDENGGANTRIRQQLERVLASPLFRNSKRYPTLLRYVVEASLEGRAESLKERTIGIEVLGRDPGYDTNTDHSVRSIAVEIRKRLAQYYLEKEHENEIRIDLPPGSYVPQFRFPAAPPAEEAAIPETTAPLPPIRVKRRFGWASAAAGATLAIAGVVIWSFASAPRQTALDRFWNPLLATSAPASLCMGSSDKASARLPENEAATQLTLRALHENTHKVAFADAVTLGRLTGLLQANHKKYRVLYEPDATLSDFREGPAVLIGGFNNTWTLRLNAMLRFTFQGSPDDAKNWIIDRQNPTRRTWSVDWTMPYLQLTEDYAVVTRVFDATTEELVIVVAGIGKYGTLAAGEFVTSPTHMEELEKLAPAGWSRKNLQVVLATKVVKGSNGPPRILQTYFW